MCFFFHLCNCADRKLSSLSSCCVKLKVILKTASLNVFGKIFSCRAHLCKTFTSVSCSFALLLYCLINWLWWCCVTLVFACQICWSDLRGRLTQCSSSCVSAGPSSLHDDLTAGFTLGSAHCCHLSRTMQTEITLVYIHAVTVAFSLVAPFSPTCMQFPCGILSAAGRNAVHLNHWTWKSDPCFGSQATVVYCHCWSVLKHWPAVFYIAKNLAFPPRNKYRHFQTTECS